ncbi:MAG: sugar transferase [Candidatus Pacearchaeota archaeon]|jgi:lipopolysaccharide/colanic/teichoic acid biosynthesis glycosyltransferase
MKLKDILIDNLYISERLGKDEAIIKVPKIRTMYHEAHKINTKMITNNGLNKIGKPSNDSRILEERRWMRQYHVDELPQLFYNCIYKRDMQLIGIRARAKNDWDRYPKKHKQRCLKEKPGLVAVRYAYLELSTRKSEIKYLAEKRACKFPLLIDLKYLSRIAYNKIILGQKSS